MNPSHAPIVASVPGPRGLGARIFLVTSLVFLVLAMLMLAGRPAFLLTPTLTGHGLSWLELLLFGFAFPAAFGLTYLALPRAFGVALFSEKFVYLHVAFHLAGTLLVLVGAAFPALQQASMGPTFLACGALVFAVNVGCSLRALTVPDPGAAFVVSAILWLVIGVLLGTPFAVKPALAIFPEGSGWSVAWLVLAIGGVAGNLAFGLALRVIRITLGAAEARPAAAWYALALLNSGIAWLFAALAFGPMSFVIFCAALCLVGSLIALGQYASILRHRSTRELGWDARILLTSFSLLPVAAVFLGLSAWAHLPPPVDPSAPAAPVPEVVTDGPLPVNFEPVDGAAMLTLLLGVVIPALAALVFSLIRLEKGLRPEAEDTFQQRLSSQILLAAFFNYAVGVLMVIPGAWVGIEKIVSLGTLFLLVGAAGFLGNYFYASSVSARSDSTAQTAPVQG